MSTGSIDNGISKVKRANADSLLDASIDQVLSCTKLNGDTVNLYFDFLREALDRENENLCLSSYFYPSLERNPQNGNPAYTKYIGKKSLWEYENVMIPVHLPQKEHWLLVVISVINLCLYIYDSDFAASKSYKDIFETLKEKLIAKELESLSATKKALFQDANWAEKTPPCPKQTNTIDCGVFTCLFAKHLLFSNFNDIYLDDYPRREMHMADDLLNLATASWVYCKC